jgi:cytidine deaminase
MANYIQSMIRIACEIALQGDEDRHYRLGAIARRKDGAIVNACNGRPSHVHAPSHAEFRLCRKLDSSKTVYVARINKHGEMAMAKPCRACQIALRRRKIEKVIYTINNNEYGVMFL